jgi:hypothetical protein
MKKIIITTIIFLIMILLAFLNNANAQTLPVFYAKRFEFSKTHVKIGEPFKIYLDWYFVNSQGDGKDLDLIGIEMQTETDELKFLGLTGADIVDVQSDTDVRAFNRCPQERKLYRYVYTYKYQFNGRDCDYPKFIALGAYSYKGTDTIWATNFSPGTLWLLQTIDAVAPKLDILHVGVRGRGKPLGNNWVHLCSSQDKVVVRLYVKNRTLSYGDRKWLWGSGTVKIRLYGTQGYIKEKLVNVRIGEEETKTIEVLLDVKNIPGPVDDQVVMEIIPTNDMYCYAADDEDLTPQPKPKPKLTITPTIFQKSDLYNTFTQNDIFMNEKVTYKMTIDFNNNIESIKIESCKIPLRITNIRYPEDMLSCQIMTDNSQWWIECENKSNINAGKLDIYYDAILTSDIILR